jgi:hypothetical protein
MVDPKKLFFGIGIPLAGFAEHPANGLLDQVMAIMQEYF